MKKLRMVELVKTDYQPTKRELERPIAVWIPGESVEERMEAIGKALAQPIKVRWIPKPRSRR